MKLPQEGSTVRNLIIVAVWVAVSAVATWFIGVVTNNPELFNPVVVGAVNVFGVAVKDYLNKNISNY